MNLSFDPLAKSSLYSELRTQQKHSNALADCVSEVMTELKTVPRDPTTDLRKPIALLGKIQSGKTRGMIGVIATAFDEGIKIVVVLTKNSTLLGQQTTRRISSELRGLPSGQASIQVDYIRDMNTTSPLSMAERFQKRVIVGIKHHTNIARIHEFLVTTNPELSAEEVLLIDDEADISSVGYRSVSENVVDPTTQSVTPTTYTEQLLVAQRINTLREALKEHYYLQVTATPASIFLQPEELEFIEYDANYGVNQVASAPIMAHKTVILPIHDKYIGGEFFFAQSGDPNSLASFAHLAVQQAELDRLMKRHQRHINNIFTSGNFPNVTHLVDNLLIAVASQVTAILKASQHLNQLDQFTDDDWQRLLANIKDRYEGLSAMMHVSTQIKLMSYHRELIESYVEGCLGAVEHDINGQRDPLKARLKEFFESSILPPLDLFKAQHGANSPLYMLELSDFDAIFTCYQKVLSLGHVRVREINVSQDRNHYIDAVTGELRRDVLANIFVGGQALDRGITIGRMVGFFYGRDPQVAQLDTTLQHARIYGARTPEDLVFTRLYMPAEVRQRLVEITEIDQVLRESIINNNGDNRFAAIELGRTGIRPTSPSRLMMSDCVSIKSHKRFLPVGFVTRSGQACSQHVDAIDALIQLQLNKIPELPTEEAYFIDWTTFEKIFDLFEHSTLDRDKWSSEARNEHWDLERLRAYYKIIKTTYFPQDDRLMLIVKRGRDQKRLKKDGRSPMSSPDTAQTDLVQMKTLMQTHNVPGVFLFEQQGRKQLTSTGLNVGWSGERFFWPLLLLPELERTIMISLDALR